MNLLSEAKRHKRVSSKKKKPRRLSNPVKKLIDYYQLLRKDAREDCKWKEVEKVLLKIVSACNKEDDIDELQDDIKYHKEDMNLLIKRDKSNTKHKAHKKWLDEVYSKAMKSKKDIIKASKK